MVNLVLIVQARNSTLFEVFDAELALDFPIISVRDLETAEDLMLSIEQDISLILLDATLGQSPVIEFCRSRRDGGFRGLLIIFSSSAYEDEDLAAEASGADAFFVIGSSAREIVDCVSDLLWQKD